MTSQISREEVIAEIHKAGVRPYSAVAKLMISVDNYAITLAHRYIPQNAPDDKFLIDPFYFLDPGDWEPDAGITRCDSCLKVRPWSPYFHLDPDHESGHRTTCKSCVRREREKNPPLPVSGGWMCPPPPAGCGSRRIPAEFPEEKRINPRRPIPCIICSPENTQA